MSLRRWKPKLFYEESRHLKNKTANNAVVATPAKASAPHR